MQQTLLHIGVVLANLTAISVANFNFKHGNDCVEQVLHESFLLSNQQRPGLQLGQRDIDRINRRRHRVHDDPPLVRWHQVGPLVLGVFQWRAPKSLVRPTWGSKYAKMRKELNLGVTPNFQH